MLIQLIYASESATKLSLDVVHQIAESAASFNASLDVTGVLLCGHGFFLQVLEGSAERVNAIYHRIARDDRHTGLRLISYGEVPERSFSRWNMRHISAASLTPEVLLQYGTSRAFRPMELRAPQAVGLLRCAAGLDSALPGPQHRAVG